MIDTAAIDSALAQINANRDAAILKGLNIELALQPSQLAFGLSQKVTRN
jgi:hypothetical protein